MINPNTLNPSQPLAGRGEPDWRALAIRMLYVESAACGLVDTLDNAERHALANKVQKAVELLREVRRECETALHAPPKSAGKRWTPDADAVLASRWGALLRFHGGDTERAVASLAELLQRSPVAVAARLCHLGIWK